LLAAKNLQAKLIQLPDLAACWCHQYCGCFP